MQKGFGSMKCNKVAFINGKGGCGKTTSIFHVAGVLADKGEKVLIIDFDKQRNSTSKFLASKESDYSQKYSFTVFDFMKGKTTIDKVVKKSYLVKYRSRNPKYINIDVLPSDKKLENESFLKGIDIKDELEQFIKEQEYTWVLIDMPPSNKRLNEICFCQIANYVIVPFTSDEFSVDGYGDLLDTVNEAREMNNDLHIIGVYLSRYDKNSALDKFILNNLKDNFGSTFIDVQIPQIADVKDATFYGKPLSFYKMFSPAKSSFENLVKEMRARIEQYN